MVFETAAKQPDAIGQQGGRQGLAREAGVGAAVEREPDGPAPIDQPAFGQASRAAHRPASNSVTAAIAWVTVSRWSVSQAPQPKV